MSEAPNSTTPAILCVDKDPAAIAQYQALVAAGYNVTIVQSAVEAIRVSARTVFDAYVIEFWLEDWTGPALCRDIRDQDPNAPILFCTSAPSERNRDRAIRAGASAWLSKPVQPSLLQSKIAGLLSIAKAESVRAELAAARAAAAELERRRAALQQGVATALEGAERVLRKKALQAFLAERGTRANFERMWQDILERAEAERADDLPQGARPPGTRSDRGFNGTA